MESIGRLAGGVAHDFNNILTSIGGNVELALMDLDPRSPLRTTLAEVTRDVDSAAALTRQLLAFSRKQIIEPRVIDLNHLIERMRKMFVRLIGEDVELVTYPMKEPALVKADPGQIEQILINLAVNARDAMPDGGKLTLEIGNAALDESYCQTHVQSKPGEYVLLAVSDTGCGMSEEIKQHLFEPFFTTKPRGKGTGLGLAMVYGAVRQNGGSIEVYSETGKGTTFKIYLPKATPGADEHTGIAGAAGELQHGSETVFLVEDESVVRDVAERFLARLGYSVHSFEDAEGAVRKAGVYEGPIHLLMTDVVMPGMNGRALADKLTASRPTLKVLYASGYTEDAIVHHGVLEAGLHFIGKPYSIFVLAKKLRDILDAP
jgi:CheY-like chemotaxis protein